MIQTIMEMLMKQTISDFQNQNIIKNCNELKEKQVSRQRTKYFRLFLKV